MTSVLALACRLYRAVYPPPAARDGGRSAAAAPNPPLRFGILGAAAIAPTALITPCLSHPDAEVFAIAARDPARAAAYAKKYGIPKVHASYQDLLDDKDVDVVYNPLPNGLHYEWTMKALKAGKHVLLEKPAADTAEETKRMFEFAEERGLVLLEAFHYRFHPAIQRFKAIVESNELGKLREVHATLSTPKLAFPDTDIRFNYELGGGAFMDMGCYVLNCVRYLTSSEPLEVVLTKHETHKTSPKVDRCTTATLSMPNEVIAVVQCDLAIPPILGFLPTLPQVTATAYFERGSVELYNFVMPTIYHTLTVTRVETSGRMVVSRKEKAYAFPDMGEDWWTTYRYQLEAFVDKVRGRTPHTWISKEDSIANMEWIEKVYDQTGLGVRPKSAYVP